MERGCITIKSLNNEFSFFDENFSEIKANVKTAMQKAGRVDDILILGATKRQSVELINYAFANGLTAMGENRVQEYLEKYDSLNLAHITQHFIGHLQTNKVKYIVDKVSMIESVSSLKLAETISEESLKISKTMKILLEVNIGEEKSKTGFLANEVEEAIRKMALLQGIEVCGLMAIPPISDKKFEENLYFEKMQKLFVDICTKNIDNSTMGNFKYLSMGMSNDYETAIAYSANIIRIGTKLFGKREN